MGVTVHANVANELPVRAADANHLWGIQMRMNCTSFKGRTVVLGTTLTLGASLIAGGPAGAFAGVDAQLDDYASEALVEESLANLTRVDSSLLVQAADDNGVRADVNGFGAGTVQVPRDLEEGVTVTGANGEGITIGLPNAEQAKPAQQLDGGVVTFPGALSANSVVVSENGVQMLTTIANADAPTRYAYTLDLEPGQHIKLVDDGAVVLDEDGVIQLTVASAWAKDALGADIPTRYEVNGSTLTQVVEHTSVEGVAYPVVADPIWLAPWVVKCLIGIGIRGPEIARIASTGSYGAIFAAGGRAAIACVFGR